MPRISFQYCSLKIFFSVIQAIETFISSHSSRRYIDYNLEYCLCGVSVDYFHCVHVVDFLWPKLIGDSSKLPPRCVGTRVPSSFIPSVGGTGRSTTILNTIYVERSLKMIFWVTKPPRVLKSQGSVLFCSITPELVLGHKNKFRSREIGPWRWHHSVTMTTSLATWL